MAVHDLTKTQRVVEDKVTKYDTSTGCNCSERIEDLESKIRQLETIILRGTIENGRDKNISNISK